MTSPLNDNEPTNEVEEQAQMESYKAQMSNPFYRPLKKGEVIEPGDQFQSELNCDYVWSCFDVCIGRPWDGVGEARRPIAPPGRVATLIGDGINPKDLVGDTKPPLSLVPPCFHV